ncbi:hypothetical protein WL1483_3895 [Aeromonas schubertii]|uniref:Uncharacterized protein n=1 Tax=Aeromonas schubertii TaxID=652 RepID=A0A0S2SNR1_9GAMM|nr:hypothetical protein WL1483_3895 [Aeromonas schubertii]
MLVRCGILCGRFSISSRVIFSLHFTAFTAQSTDTARGATDPHADQSALYGRGNNPFHGVDIGACDLIECFIHAVLLGPLFKCLTDPFTSSPFTHPFEHAATGAFTGQHLEQHGVSHQGTNGSRSPSLGIPHGGLARNIGGFFACQLQLLAIREMCGLLIGIDA